MRAARFSVVLLVLFANAAGAQREEVLVPRAIVSGGFGGPVVKLTAIHGDRVVLTGGRGGWIVNHQFLLGGAGYGMTDQDVRTAYTNAAGEHPRLEMGYGGVELGYVHQWHRVVHVTVGALLGGGGVSYQSDTQHDMRSDAFTVAEPEAGVETNVTHWLRIMAGASYRFVGGARLPDVTDAQLSGATATLTFKFGRF